MGEFRSFTRSVRHQAVPMQPVVDPAGWQPHELGDVSEWAYAIDESDADALSDAVAAFRRTGAAIVDVNRDNFPLGRFAELLADVKRELLDGRGMVMLRGFPIERWDRETIAVAYLGLGSHLGDKMAQNGHGHVLGHVKDIGGDYETGRGYNSNAGLRFHADGCDYVGLLCLKISKSGGESRVASSVTVYNKLLESRPDLVEILRQDFYRSHNGEMSPGETPWFTQPIFSFAEGYFSATGAGSTIEKAQRIAGVPPSRRSSAKPSPSIARWPPNVPSTFPSYPATSNFSTTT